MTDIIDPEIRDNIRWLINEKSLIEGNLERISGWAEDGTMSRQLREAAFDAVDKLHEVRSHIIDLLDIISDYTWDDEPEDAENLEGASETRSNIQTVAEGDPFRLPISDRERVTVEVVHRIDTPFGPIRIAYDTEDGRLLGDCICPPGADEPDFDCPRHRR